MDMVGEGVMENCTEWNISCLQADLEDEMLNPELHTISAVRFWIDGGVLPVIVGLAVISNCILLRGISCRQARTSDWILGLLSLTSVLLLVALTVRRVPPALGHSLPLTLIVPALTAVEKGLTTLFTFLFIIFVGDRHLRTIDLQSYSWVRPLAFCLTVSVLVAVPVLWEYRVQTVMGEDLTQIMDMTLSPMSVRNMSNMTEVEVVRRTALWHDTTYRNMVRYLLTLLTSQVANIWLLPIIFLHSRDMNKTLRKQRKRTGRNGRRPDPLVPTICLLFMLLSLPNLADLFFQILLYRVPLLLRLLTGLSLSLLLLLVPLLTVILDPDIKRKVICFSLHLHRTPVPVPTEEF